MTQRETVAKKKKEFMQEHSASAFLRIGRKRSDIYQLQFNSLTNPAKMSPKSKAKVLKRDPNLQMSFLNLSLSVT